MSDKPSDYKIFWTKRDNWQEVRDWLDENDSFMGVGTLNQTNRRPNHVKCYVIKEYAVMFKLLFSHCIVK